MKNDHIHIIFNVVFAIPFLEKDTEYLANYIRLETPGYLVEYPSIPIYLATYL